MPSESALRDRDGTGFELIETMRWEPGVGFVRLDRHLRRLYRSAAALGFASDPRRIDDALGTVWAVGPLRVRLVLAADGSPAVTMQSFAPLPAEATWRVRIAATRLDSGDPLLRHKTSRRAAYELARSEFQVAQADEVILLNERGEVCEGTITSLFIDTGDGGPLLTPPLACGLLDGVLRAELLETGRAREAVLTPGDLVAAKALWVGNSLRGLLAAKLES